MLQDTPEGFPRARTLLPETPDPPSVCGVSPGAGEPSAFTAVAVERLVERLTRLDEVDGVAVRRSPARCGEPGDWPPELDPRVVAHLGARGLPRPWSHQVEAIRAIRAGRDVVLATATASGKSLCFQVPLLDAALRDPSARSLLLFPTKALARDQVDSLRRIGDGIVGVGAYDGDTPPDERRATRARAHAVATNPDMLHRAILPNHERWAALFSGLRLVVLDELHTYRGVFGSHVANVLRRLWRVCARHSSSPQVVACSATIADAGALAVRLTGRPDPLVIDRDGAPAPARTFVVLNPRVVDPQTGVRRDYLKVTRKVVGEVRRSGMAALAFCRTRKAVELLTRYLREDEAGIGVDRFGAPVGPVDMRALQRAQRRIRGYRGGYLPELRREIERSLRAGEARIVASTNALELGMDIGGLDAVVLAGYPGTRAATWQRVGRAGRRGAHALGVLVLSSRPLDQFIAASPGFLFDEPVEHARVDPDNPEILVPHLRCAAHELPFVAGEALAGLDASELAAALEYLADRGALHRLDAAPGPARYRAAGHPFPADDVDLRGRMEENFTVVELAPGTASDGRILAEVAFEDAPLYLHPGAIYPLEGSTYEVRALDWAGRKARVARVDVGYYTQAVTELRVRMLDDEPGPGGAAGRGSGFAHVVRSVPGFKKLRFSTHENVGFGPVDLPPLELHTVAAWWRVPAPFLAVVTDPVRRADAALAAAHALHHVAAMLLMCDPGDLGRAVAAAHDGAWAVSATRRSAELLAQAGATPCIFLYDQIPGGVGLARRVAQIGAPFLRRVERVVAACACGRGCPTCVGSEVVHAPSARADALELLVGLAEQAAS
jgi:DEAD/DEAH box helicase domain-containing protein